MSKGKPRRKRGRPPLPESERCYRQHTIDLRVSTEERDLIDAAARRLGVPRSEYLRNLGVARAKELGVG